MGLKTESFWIDQNNHFDSEAWKIVNLSIFVHFDIKSDLNEQYDTFKKDAKEQLKNWPFYCKACSNHQKQVIKKNE